MEEHHFEIVPLLWLAGWLLAVVMVFWAALKLPLETTLGRWAGWLYAGGVALAAGGVCVLANVALVLDNAALAAQVASAVAAADR